VLFILFDFYHHIHVLPLVIHQLIQGLLQFNEQNEGDDHHHLGE
jgi:hypothetical protein